MGIYRGEGERRSGEKDGKGRRRESRLTLNNKHTIEPLGEEVAR